MSQLNFSARGFHRIQKLARTTADLVGSEEIQSAHLAEALQYRPKLMTGLIPTPTISNAVIEPFCEIIEELRKVTYGYPARIRSGTIEVLLARCRLTGIHAITNRRG